MGAKIPIVALQDDPPDVLYVNDKLRGKKKGFGFSRTMFSKLEWRTLKKFCLSNGITQLDLNGMYIRYLSNDAALTRKMRILLRDVSCQFDAKSSIYQDVMQVLCPCIFLREHEGLKEAHSNSEISFARFIIVGYDFCLQPVADTIFDYFSISRRSMIKVSATIFAYNMQECVKVFCSELNNSATKRFVCEKCIGDDDEEISILSAMQMGIKYPLMFYQLFLFQKHFKRLIFGDQFWKNREKLPSRFADAGLNYEGSRFSNEQNVLQETARQILADFSEVETKMPRLCCDQREPIICLTSACCERVKNSLGYRWARQLIAESGLDYPQDQCFADIPPDVDNEVRLYDNKIDSDFVYNVGTGYRAWVEKHKLRNGEVVKELWHRTSADL